MTPAPSDPHEHMLRTYAALRKTLVIVGIGLPLLLMIGSWVLGMPIQDSMSQYYHADAKFRPTEEERVLMAQAAKLRDALTKAHREPTEVEQISLRKASELDSRLFARPGGGELRDWFVGGLFIIGILLIVYKGFLQDEDIALNLAGLFAFGVAIFHMPWGQSHSAWDNHRSWIDEVLEPFFHLLPWEQNIPSVHYLCAISLFLCLGYVCFWCGAATLELAAESEPGRNWRQLNPEEKRFFLWAYRACGLFMVSSVFLGPMISHIPGTGFHHSKVFWIETIGVLGFAAYWALKSYEIATTGADRLAAARRVEVVRSDSFFKGHKLRLRVN